MISFRVDLPAVFLVQKVHFELSDQFTVEQFLHYFSVSELLRHSE